MSNIYNESMIYNDPNDNLAEINTDKNLNRMISVTIYA